MGRHDVEQALLLREAAVLALARRCGGRGGAEGGEARLLDARVHVGLVVVADVEHVVVAVDGAGERLQADVRRAAVAGETHHGDVLGRRPLGAQARLDAREHRRRGRKGRDHRVVAEGQLREVETGGAHAASGQRRHRMGSEHLERLAHG